MSVFPKDPGPSDYDAYLCSPEELESSHDRCRALKIPVELDRPRKILPKIELAPRLAENSLLLTAVERVITPHHYAGPQKDHIYILCDSELVAMKIFAAPEVLVAVKEAGVKPGTVFTEESCSTNALALTKKHQRLVVIRGEQHYCKLFKDWWCVAGPVKDPAGKICGFLDISMHAEKELGLTAQLLENLLSSIERELYLWELEQKLKQTDVRLPPGPVLPIEITRELTPREREVLGFILLGLNNEKIAAEFNLSPQTVKTHRKHVYRKVGVHSRGELIAKFRR